MQGRGFIRFVAILLAIASLYHLSFSWVVSNVEKDAKEFAKGDSSKEIYYLDSIAFEPVYDLGFASYTYLESKEKQLNLGLDLKGGMNVTMEVSMSDLIRSMANNSKDADFNKAIEMAKAESTKSGSKDFVTLFVEAYAKIAPNGKLATIFATAENKGTININSTNQEVIAVLHTEAESAFNRSFEILRTRIDKFGVTQPNIQKIGGNRILIELPGVTDPNRVRKLLQGSAQLEFWETYENQEVYPILESINSAVAARLALTEKENEASLASNKNNDAVAKADTSSLMGKIKNNTATDSTSVLSAKMAKENPLFTILMPNTNGQQLVQGATVGYATIKDTATVNKYLAMPEVKALLPSNLRLAWTVKAINDRDIFGLVALKTTGRTGRAALEGNVISSARADFDQMTGQPEVIMFMNAEGAREWRRITAEAAAANNRSIAIVLDNAVYSAPSVSNEISGGVSSISGNFKPEETQDLANILKAGKLPAPAKIVEEATVGPTLGQEAISAGLLSCIAGLAAVFILMTIYYNKAGVVANIALLINLFLMIGVLASFGAVLTLPGIAGITLILGMAVDANVLIYERIKEELQKGIEFKKAVREGFRHAYSAIIDANVTILLLGIILYSFSTGLVQGFATTLVIGIFTSLFCSVFITRLIFERFLDKDANINLESSVSRSLFGKVTNFDFIGQRKKYYIISGVVIAIGLVSLFTKGLGLGVDLQGGRTYTVRFDKDVQVGQVRDALTLSFDGQAPEVKTFGGASQVRITTAYKIEETSETVDAVVESKLQEGLAKIDPSAQIMDSRKVGPTIASDIRNSAFTSIGLALLVVYIYIIIRFRRWQFGLSATIALFHDVLMIVSMFSIFNGILPFSLDVDQTFIAAILTILGYSMNDTVVVFDRIREYMGLHHTTKNSQLTPVVNKALNSTLSRTMMTSFSTFLVLLVLFIFGGEILRGFSFALLIGVVVGTYSSLFIATPVVIDLMKENETDKK